jgi:hypothetical protein
MRLTYARFHSQLHKRSQLFIVTHNETLSFAVRVNDPDCAPVIVEG